MRRFRFSVSSGLNSSRAQRHIDLARLAVRRHAELREQLASAQDMLVETAIDAGNMHALVEAMRIERDAWREEAERLRVRAARMA